MRLATRMFGKPSSTHPHTILTQSSHNHHLILTSSCHRIRSAAPDVGEHTDDVLKSAGLTDIEVEQLRSIGAVGASPIPGSPLSKWMALAPAK